MGRKTDKAKIILNIEEAKQHKVKTIISIAMRIIIVVIAVLSIIKGNYENTLTCFLTLILLTVPSFIEKTMKIDLPNMLEIFVLCFVFAANILGEIGSFYEKIPMLDTILHTLNGFICAAVGFGLIDILNENDKIKISLSPLFVCLFSFCFSMTAGTIWEFFEFSMDMLFGKDMQKDTVVTAINSVLISGGETNEITRISGITDTVVNGKSLGIDGYLDIGLIDTMKDLLVNFVGAIVFNISGFFFLRYRGKKVGFIRNFIPHRITDGRNRSHEADVEESVCND